MNGIETQSFSNGSHVDDTTSNEANVEEISEREMHEYLARYLSAGLPERRRIFASERVLRSELDSTMTIAHDNIVEHVRDYRSLEFFLVRNERERGVEMSRLINAVLTTLEEEGDVSLLEILTRNFRRHAHEQVDKEQGRNTLHYHAVVNDNPTRNFFPFGSVHLIGFRNPQDPDYDSDDDEDLPELNEMMVENCVKKFYLF